MSMNPCCPPFNCPPCPDPVEALEKAIRGEAEAIKFYTGLISMAPPYSQKIIIDIRKDEEKHLNNFQATYCMLIGNAYIFPEPCVSLCKTYRENLMKAFDDEQEAYESYKTNFFCNMDPTVRFSFQDALMDEAEHARWFNNLLIREMMKGYPRHGHHEH